jgi:hypothetical protein
VGEATGGAGVATVPGVSDDVAGGVDVAAGGFDSPQPAIKTTVMPIRRKNRMLMLARLSCSSQLSLQAGSQR